MNITELKQQLAFQKKAKGVKLIPGLTMAQSDEWRSKRIKELQKLINAQTGKSIRRKPKKG